MSRAGDGSLSHILLTPEQRICPVLDTIIVEKRASIKNVFHRKNTPRASPRGVALRIQLCLARWPGDLPLTHFCFLLYMCSEIYCFVFS